MPRNKALRRIVQTVVVIVILILGGYSFLKYQYFLLNYTETNAVKSFFIETIEAELPSENWKSKVYTWDKAINPEDIFYFYKLWFIESGTSRWDVRTAYPLFAGKIDENYYIDLYYKNNQPIIRCHFFKQDNQQKIAAAFPMNNCMFAADYNHDDKIDRLDVKLALSLLQSKGENIRDK